MWGVYYTSLRDFLDKVAESTPVHIVETAALLLEQNDITDVRDLVGLEPGDLDGYGQWDDQVRFCAQQLA